VGSDVRKVCIVISCPSIVYFFLTDLFLEVKAVDHPLLRNYVDVVVFSVQGPRRLIDWLAGGIPFFKSFGNDLLKA
jgi:RNA dependent RNA polymerase